jgi:hypothetical protein
MYKEVFRDTKALSKIMRDHKMTSQMLAHKALEKAAEVTTTDTFDPETRSIWSPENLEEEVLLTVPQDTPLRNRIPRELGEGQATAWERLTSKLHVKSGGAAGIGTNTSIAFADAGAPNETDQDYTVESQAYKLIGRKLEVGGLAIAASRNRKGGNHFDQRFRHKMIEVMIGEEELIIGGDASVNTLEFNGLGKQILTNSGSRSLLTTSGINNDIATTLYKEGGSPELIVANARSMQALSDELQGTGTIQRITLDDQGNAVAGLRVSKMINAIDGTVMDLITSRYTADQGFLLQILDKSGKILIDVSELIPMSRIDVPSSNFSDIGFLVQAEALRVWAEPYQYKYTGLDIS